MTRYRVRDLPPPRATSGTEAFCDPHSPWQKGAIENTIGRIRRFLPGDRNLAELADDEL
jgi:IS30 family transposase